MRFLRRLLLLGAFALVVLGALAWFDYARFLTSTPLELQAEEADWVVAPGTSYRGMVTSLQQQGLIQGSWHWRVLGWLDARTSKLQAGEYRLQSDMTPQDLLDLLAEGRVRQYRFTIVEGWNFRELRVALAADPVLEQTLADLDGEAIIDRLELDIDHPEGWFLPETYQFPRGTSDADLLRRAHGAMRRALDAAWEQRADDLPYADPYEVLIMASIIEKETAVPAERNQIAGVFVRRLARGMRLQTDPTVIYGIGDSYDGDIRFRDLRTDTPYNTYTRAGLPPTPIAMPGTDALLAAVQPAAGDALYFVSRNDGSHQFSATLEEHERAVDRYQRNR